MNCIIGRNGSGKSNLLDAVQFVLLSPRFSSLRQEERQSLLHEGSGSAAVNAFVEIVFDNHDKRFALEHSDEVVLRRTIGLKKDEFFLQRKRVQQSQVISLLEGAGFSRANPYYIVPQGKLQDLCTMQDKERLLLLQQVAGTTVYDDKKKESLKKMHENEESLQKIADILNDISAKLADLETEKEELTEYQRHDRARRAISYTLYDKELAKARDLLNAIDQDKRHHMKDWDALHVQCKESHDQIRNLESNLSLKAQAVKRHTSRLEMLQQEWTPHVQRRAQLEVRHQELQEGRQASRAQTQQEAKELKSLREQVVTVQSQLEEVEPEYKTATTTLDELTNKFQTVKRELQALYDLRARKSQFTSRQERDTFLQESIQNVQDSRQQAVAKVESQRQALAHARRVAKEESAQVTKIQSELQERTASLQSCTKALDDEQRQRLDLSHTRQQAWRKTESLQEELRLAKEAHQGAKSNLYKTMPRATALGLEALLHVVEQEGLANKYFGLVMDNFTLKDPKYQIAVEVAAQNSLFHVIVDTDETASRLLKRLEQDKLGRVTFLPLNRLKRANSNVSEDSTDVAPLLSTCVEFEPRVAVAMQHVFGQKWLARSTTIATEWSTRHGVDSLTLDGDLATRKGALSGGYVDSSKMRLQAHIKAKEARKRLAAVEDQYQKERLASSDLDNQVTAMMSSIQRHEAQQVQLKRQLQTKETELERLQAKSHDQQIAQLEESLPPLERQVASFDADISHWQAELETDFEDNTQDEEQLRELKEEKDELAKQVETETEKVNELGIQRQALSSRLNEHLQKHIHELEGNQRRKSIMDNDDEVDEASRLLDEARRVEKDHEERLQEARKEQDKLRKEMAACKNELDQIKSQDVKNANLLQEASDKTERLMNKRFMCISKRETYMRKIQELGSLPAPTELQKYAGKSISDLMKSIESVNKKLKKYAHVNKKAFDQYLNFSEQRETLLKRKAELDQGASKVQELVESLDRQKDEAINRTFRGVSSHFKDVFKELVPNGAGELIMRTAMDEETDDEADSDLDSSKKPKKVYDPNNPDVSLYRGVGIKVRFSEVGENYMMSQLSGGQKSLVAMALIFAIQRCDPAPFYIFDELDQALDAAYRASVANLIQRQAHSKDNPTQFIVSTFRPELVKASNTCYGISLQNKVSSLHHLGKKEALKFIANLMEEEEAVGEVTTVAKKSRPSRKRKVDDDDDSSS